jgi:asparagine synthase (glutamine-hydrolysing)
MPFIAGIVDWQRPPTAADLDGLVAALAPEGNARSLLTDGLALAWTGDHDPVERDRTLLHIDGNVYAVAGEVEGPLGPAALATLHARLGDALFPKLRADAVVLVHDRRRRRVQLGRDQLGGKGLIWHRNGPRVRFASEVAQLLRLLPSRPGPDIVSLAHWLAPSGSPGDRTMHEGVQRLVRGEILTVHGRDVRTARYWLPTPPRRPTTSTMADAAAGLRTHLETAVRRRSTGPATTAVLLSGGLDSSSVAAVGATLDADHRPKLAYSATFPSHPSIDETELIELTAADLDLRSTKIDVTSGSVLAGAVTYIERWNLPPMSPNLFFWLPLLDRVHADGVRVLLDGEGGDEAFGLSPFLISDRLARGRVRAAAELVRQVPGGRPDLPRDVIVHWLKLYGFKGLVPGWAHRTARRVRGAGRYAPDWVRPEVARHFLTDDLEAAWKRHRGPRWWAYLLDAVATGAASTLGHDHVRLRGAMCGIENRHPLVDVDVLEYVLGLDPNLAFDPRWSRPVFREAVRGVLGDRVRLRPDKSTFNATFQEALAGPDLAVARVLLAPGQTEVEAYVDLDAARATLMDAIPPAGPERDWWSLYFWRLLTAELWLRAEAGRPADEPWRTLLAEPVLALRP